VDLNLVTDDRREQQVQVWLDTEYENASVELVVLMHVKRLMHGLGFHTLSNKVSEKIEWLIQQNNIDKENFQLADTITEICDVISFDFCFENNVKGQREVFQKPGLTGVIDYSISGSDITLDPWPLSTARYDGYILGYQRVGYPEKLEPVLLRYSLIQA